MPTTPTDWSLGADAAHERLVAREEAGMPGTDWDSRVIALRGLAAMVRTAQPTATALALRDGVDCEVTLPSGETAPFVPAELREVALWERLHEPFHEGDGISTFDSTATVVQFADAAGVLVSGPGSATRWIDLDAAIDLPVVADAPARERASIALTGYVALHATDAQISAWGDLGTPGRHDQARSELLRGLLNDLSLTNPMPGTEDAPRFTAQQIANHAADAVIAPGAVVDTLVRQHPLLPTWPDGLPAPEVTLDRDPDGSITTTLHTGSARAYVTGRFDGNAYTHQRVTWADSTGIDTEHLETVNAWLTAVWMRAADSVSAVEDTAVRAASPAILDRITTDTPSPNPHVLADLVARGVTLPDPLPAPIRPGATFAEIPGAPATPGERVTLDELGIDGMTHLPDFTSIAITANPAGGYAVDVARALDIEEIAAGMVAATTAVPVDTALEDARAQLPAIAEHIEATYDADVTLDDHTGTLTVTFHTEVDASSPVAAIRDAVYGHPGAHQFADDTTTGQLFADLAASTDAPAAPSSDVGPHLAPGAIAAGEAPTTPDDTLRLSGPTD